MNLNKNKICGLLILILFLIIIPKVSSASFISLESSSKKIKVNETLNVSVYIDPTSSMVYTAQVAVDFPADLVSVESFEYASYWLPITQSNYDLIDNENGKLIKTVGYPGGFNKKMLLGTLVLKAKQAGNIDLSINKESFVLDIDNNNTFIDSVPLSVIFKDPSRNIFTRLWNFLFS